MIQRADIHRGIRAGLPSARIGERFGKRLATHDQQRSQRVVGIVLWVAFVATLIGIGALRGA